MTMALPELGLPEMRMPEMGLIEGFFGRPWSWRERVETLRFLRPHGYTFYIYAPKADPYLREHWQQPHSDEAMHALAGFAAECRAQRVRFGIGLSPFELYREWERGWQDILVRKLKHLQQLGLDDLAILFDDQRGDVPDLAQRQAAIVGFVADQGIAARLLFCPSYYSDDEILDVSFGRRPRGYLQQLGRLVDPKIEIMWTGPEVCSKELTVGHLARVGELLARRPFLWDNYPVNDGARMSQHLHLRAFTGRPAAIARHIAAHAVNPASQAMLSRIPALTLADSYRDGDGYDYGVAFFRAAWEVLGPQLGGMVQRDLLLLQERGLDRIAVYRANLRERYAAIDHPAAREIVSWVDGRWNVTDKLVQTQ